MVISHLGLLLSSTLLSLLLFGDLILGLVRFST